MTASASLFKSETLASDEQEASRPEPGRLAKNIIEAQKAEIRAMKGIAEDLGVTPAEMPMDGEMSDQTMEDLEALGVTKEKSGMNMDVHELHGASRSIACSSTR